MIVDTISSGSCEDFDDSVYFKELRRKTIIIASLSMLTVVALIGSVFVSQLSDMTISDVFDVLRYHIFGGTPPNEIFNMVVWDFNMPRAILGLVVGASLAVGGAVMQTILRNPLATPYTTGVSAGASMGAALYIYLGFALFNTGEYMSTITINAVVFAMLPTLAILLVSQQKHITPTTMILAGIAMMYVFSALTSLLMLLADPENVQESYEWNIGSLGRASWSNIGLAIVGIIPCALVLQFLAKDLHVMNAGNRSAITMGLDVKAIRNVSLILVAIMTALGVGITGGIGFMGLIAPHIARILVGSEIKYLLPCSAALGALILLVADAASRIIIHGGIPVGVLTAVIGGPIFIAILIKGAKKVWF